MSSNALGNSLQALAEQINGCDANAAMRLKRLKDAVERGVDANIWAATDIYKIIDPETITENFKSQLVTSTIIGFVELVRNTFIFAPIILTWYSISQATTKYNELLESAIQHHNLDLVSQPFLYLWQQRFGGTLPGWLTLSSIATADAVILVVIFALTFFAYILSNTNAAWREQQARKLRSDLVQVIADTTLFLHSKTRQTQPLIPTQPLTAGDNLEKVALQFDAMSRQIVGQFTQMTQQVTDRFERMAGDVTGRFATMAQETRTQFDQIGQEATRQLQKGSEYLRDLGDLTSGVVQIAHDMQSAASELRATNGELSASINSLVVPAEALAKQQAELVDAVNTSVDLLKNTSRAIDGLVTKQESWGADLKGTLDTLELGVENAVTLVNGVEDFITQQRTFLQHLQNEHDTQSKLAIMMSDATVRVKESLESLKDGSVSLRKISVDMNDIMRMQASRKPGDTSQPSEVASQATVEAIENAGTTLKASAVAIYKASQRLTEVLDNWEQSRQNGHA